MLKSRYTDDVITESEDDDVMDDVFDCCGDELGLHMLPEMAGQMQQREESQQEVCRHRGQEYGQGEGKEGGQGQAGRRRSVE